MINAERWPALMDGQTLEDTFHVHLLRWHHVPGQDDWKSIHQIITPGLDSACHDAIDELKTRLPEYVIAQLL